MSILTVGTGAQYATIAAAVAASASGDTIQVKAGTYTNDFLTIRHSLTLDAVGGTVFLVATAQPPDGKAINTEGAVGADVTINGFNISGAAVQDGNGAGIRYEGGQLTLNNVNIHDNQNGLLAASDPSGSITIANSTFTHNGTGDGRTHNIYVNTVGSLTVRDSTITNAVVGHQIKSRALSTTIVNNTISDGAAGTASYEIDLPNGGVAVIEGNLIQKGAQAQNPIAISYGEEGGVYDLSSLTVTGNTMVNNYTAHQTTAVKNTTNITATVSGNHLSGWTAETSGLVTVGTNALPATDPTPVVATPTVNTDPVPAAASPTVNTDPVPAAASPTVKTDPVPAAASPIVNTDPVPAAASPIVNTDPVPAAASPTVNTDPVPAAASPIVNTDPVPAAASPTVNTDPVPTPTTPAASGNNATVTTGTLEQPSAPTEFLTDAGDSAAPVAAEPSPAAVPKLDAGAVPGANAIVQTPQSSTGPAVGTATDLAPVPPAALTQPDPSGGNGSGSGASSPFPIERGSVTVPHHSSGHPTSSTWSNHMFTFHN